MMDEMLSIIGNVGFPIAVSAYLLIRIEGKLGELTMAIGELREAIISIHGQQFIDLPRAVVIPGEKEVPGRIFSGV